MKTIQLREMEMGYLCHPKILFFLFGIISLALLSSCGASGTFTGNSSRNNADASAQIQSPPEDSFQQGLKDFQNFKYTQAKKNFDKTLTANPRHQEALFYRGRCFIKMNNLNQALQDFNRILSLNNQNAQGLAGRAEVLMEKKKLSEAMHEIEKALDYDMNLAYAWYLKGLIFGYQNKLDKAVAAFKTCLDKNMKYAYAHYQLGLAYNQKNRPDLAVIHLELFLELAPNAPESGKVRDLLNRLRFP